MKHLLLTLTAVAAMHTHTTAQEIKLNGSVSAENNQVKNVADPTDAQDAATKGYVDMQVSSFSGDYNDLTNKPTTISTKQAEDILVNNTKTSFPGFGNIAGKALEGNTALFSGSYNDLTDKPTIYTQEQVDLLIADLRAELGNQIDNNGDGYSEDAGDCDDSNASITKPLTWYLDSDADGYGSSTSIEDCTQPVGYVAQDGDCNDSNPEVYPGAIEVCDGIDNDCDGDIDEDFVCNTAPVVTEALITPVNPTLHDDLVCVPSVYDGDGDPVTLTYSWYINGSFTGNNSILASVNTSIGDVVYCVVGAYDGKFASFAFTTSSVEILDADQDGDGYLSAEDCNDLDSSVNPGATEICDGLDNDCNGLIDDNAADTITWYFDYDDDGDGYGGSNTLNSCTQPAGYVFEGGDCDDTKADVNPGATEVLDGIDNDCDGEIDEGLYFTSQVSFEQYFNLETAEVCTYCDMFPESQYDVIFAYDSNETPHARMFWNESSVDVAFVNDKTFDDITINDVSSYYFCIHANDSHTGCSNLYTAPTDFFGIYKTSEGNYYAVEYISETASEVSFHYKKLN